MSLNLIDMVNGALNFSMSQYTCVYIWSITSLSLCPDNKSILNFRPNVTQQLQLNKYSCPQLMEHYVSLTVSSPNQSMFDLFSDRNHPDKNVVRQLKVLYTEQF